MMKTKGIVKNAVSLGMCFIIAASLVTGCGKGNNKANESNIVSGKDKTTESEMGKDNSGDKTIPEKPEEIIVMIWDRGEAAPGTTMEKNSTTQFIQEQALKELNIKVNYVSVPRTGADDKLNVMMAGGTAPDIVFSYNRDLFLDYANKGGLTDLTEAVESYGPNIKKYSGEEVLKLGQLDGRQYGLSATSTGLQSSKYTSYIRKDWLDALGRDLPTNREELVEILYEFKEKDPGNVGKDKLVPWAAGAKPTTERYFANFITTYADADQWDKKSEVVYEGYYKNVKPGTKEGFRVVNRLYNDGIISPDFAIDTTEDKFKQDILNGYVGFFVEDGDKPLGKDWYDTLKTNAPEAELVAVNPYLNAKGDYTIPAVSLFQKCVMVPKTSEAKVETIVKFLDWIIQPEIANAIDNGWDTPKDADGDYIPLSRKEKDEKGYPNNEGDYNLLNRNPSDIYTKEEHLVKKCKQYPYLSEEYLSEHLDTITTDVFNEHVFASVLDNQLKYGVNLKKMLVEFQYKVISCKAEDFDKVYEEEYRKLDEAGLGSVLEERAEYYDNKVAE